MRISVNNSDSKQHSSLPLREMLKVYMNEKKITAFALSNILDIGRKPLDAILEGGELKLNYALRIMNLLGISDKDLVKSYMEELEDAELESLDKTKRIGFILDKFDIDGLKEAGVINTTKDFGSIEKSLCHFWGFEDIYEYDNYASNVLFSKSKITIREDKEHKMQRFWVKCANEAFQRANNPNEYDEALLITFLKRIKNYTKDTENGLNKALYVLYSLGVTVLVQPYVNHTKAFGISMLVNEKPCIVVTDMGKRYHKLWLTLLHELYHVVNDYEYLQNTNFHITNPEEEDLFVSEKDADSFAINTILPSKTLEVSRKLIGNPYKIREIAKISDIHPTMIYGIYLETLQKNQKDAEYIKYTRYLLKSDIAIKNIIFDPINQKGIIAAVDKIKKQLEILTA